MVNVAFFVKKYLEMESKALFYRITLMRKKSAFLYLSSW